MKNRLKTVWIAVALCCAVYLLPGCGSRAADNGAASSSAQEEGAVSEPAPAVSAPETPALLNIDTDYYVISVPAGWAETGEWEIIPGDPCGYSLCFYEKQSFHEIEGGFLFSIGLLPDDVDYTYYPDYDIRGSVEIDPADRFNVVVTYPTDVQFTQETAEQYCRMADEIDAILNTIVWNADVVFSATPLPITPEVQ